MATTPSRFDPLPDEDHQNSYLVGENECPYDVATDKIKKYGTISKKKKIFMSEHKSKHESDRMQEIKPLLEEWKKAYFNSNTVDHLTSENIGTDDTLGGTLSSQQQLKYKAEMDQYTAEKVQQVKNLKQNDRVQVFNDFLRALIEYEEMELDNLKSEIDPNYVPRCILEQEL